MTEEIPQATSIEPLVEKNDFKQVNASDYSILDKQKRLFVGGIDYDTTAEEVQEFFGRFAEIVDVTLPADKDAGRHRGFAFVTFASSEVSCLIEFQIGSFLSWFFTYRFNLGKLVHSFSRIYFCFVYPNLFLLVL